MNKIEERTDLYGQKDQARTSLNDSLLKPTQDTDKLLESVGELIRDKRYHEAAVLYENLNMFKEAGEYYKQHAKQHRNDAEKCQGELNPQPTFQEKNRSRKRTEAEIESDMKANYAKAAEAYKKAVAMYEKAGLHHEHAIMCREVAQSLKRVEDWEQAAKYYEKAAEVLKAHNIDHSWADSYLAIARGLRKKQVD